MSPSESIRLDGPRSSRHTDHPRAARPDPLAGEDLRPGGAVFRVEPTFEHLAVAIVEHADDARLHIDAGASCAHLAQGAHVVVVAEHVVLLEPEPHLPHLAQPRDERILAAYVSRHRVRTRDVPYDIRGDEGAKRGVIARSEGVCCPTVRAGVGVLGAHGRNTRESRSPPSPRRNPPSRSKPRRGHAPSGGRTTETPQPVSVRSSPTSPPCLKLTTEWSEVPVTRRPVSRARWGRCPTSMRSSVSPSRRATQVAGSSFGASASACSTSVSSSSPQASAV